MGYIGNSPVSGPARITEGSGTGDGSTTSFPMGFSPGSDKEVFAFIDGIKQDTTAYSVSGSNCVFTTAPIDGENLDFIGYEVGKSVVPQDGSIDQSKINTASITPIVQSVRTADGAVATGSTLLVRTTGIPTNTEGDEYITVSITPTSSTNNLIIEASLTLSSSVSNWLNIALFQDSITNAVAANFSWAPNATGALIITLNYEMVAGTTTSTTFKVRAGQDFAGTMTFNGDSGAVRFGGVMNSYIKVTEVMV